ncbi:MAG: sulfide/dihydroorotate dehydrogenase-like FAD/NAD-binding protein [Actinobacteria bacterium]|nr:sulfide/dihydroorotate dehydrogenase-like FAD/NAD-binding protein [Actinomycetota bacterium]
MLAPDVVSVWLQAQQIARVRKPGQFIILRIAEGSERLPLTIADVDPAAGTIRLIVQAVGKTTRQLAELEVGQAIRDVVGPLGKPTHLENFGHAVCVGGGVGTAVVYPIAQALAGLGNKVTAIVGGRTKDYVILESELAQFCTEVIPTTDDGSYGRKGFVTTALKDLLDGSPNPPIKAIYAVGPVPMMKAVSELTRPYAIYTVVSLNPIMVDGTGMCGGCRVTVNGKSQFACVDGPEFDGHLVDFDELSDRLKTYREAESQALKRYEQHQCKLKGTL